MPKIKLPDPSLPWPIAMRAVALIAEKEGLRLTAYKCPAGKWTLGYGETDGIVEGMKWTKKQADERFCDALIEYTAKVLAMCKRTPNQNQLGALVSLAYNIGLGSPKVKSGLYRSSVLRLFNAGNDTAASRAFGKFDNITNPKTKKLEEAPGLVIRRAAEAALYLTPIEDSDAPPEPMPQAVAAESSLAASPIAKGGAAATGAGALTLLSAVNENAGTVADTASTLAPVAAQAHAAVQGVSGFLGVPTPYLLGIALVAAGVAIAVHLYKQRQEGRA